MYGYQGGKGEGGMNWEFGVDIYTLICIKQITNLKKQKTTIKKDVVYIKKNLVFALNFTNYNLLSY